MNYIIKSLLMAGAAMLPSGMSAKPVAAPKATIILVHGAFAEASSWNGVTQDLIADGYRVIAAANPLRGVKTDADYLARIVASIDGPVVLVGHSYGGEVISSAANGQPNVKALVYVAAFALDAGESAASIGARFPGGTLGAALATPVNLADGSHDLYIRQDRFRDQFAADLPVAQAAVMATTQRPVADVAFGEVNGAPAWRNLPSWFVYGSRDQNITAAAQEFMAKRAAARKTVAINGASHMVMVSHPDAVAALIEDAAAAR